MSTARDPLGRAFHVLAWMTEQDRNEWGVREIAQGTGMPAASAHRVLAALERLDLVGRLNGQYTLGLELIRLSQRVVAHVDVNRVAESHLRDLVVESGEQAYLCIIDRQRGTVMFGPTVEADHALRYTVEQYRWEPLHLGASCLGALAFVSGHELAALDSAGHLQRLCDDEGLDRRDLDAQLADIREAGYALTRGRHTPGAVGVAAPIHDHHERVLGNVMLTIPEQRFEPTDEARLSQLVMEAADRISAGLGSATKVGSGRLVS